MIDSSDDFLFSDDSDDGSEKREIFDENGINIFTKKSSEKTVEERIKTSRTLKIKHNKWNQVDYTEDFSPEDKIVIDPQYYQYSYSFEDVQFEEKFQEIIENSPYKELFMGNEQITINYQVVMDMLLYCYGKMKKEYSMCQIFVLLCEYCRIGLGAMWKRLSSYVQVQILEELREVSNLPNEILDNDVKLF